MSVCPTEYLVDRQARTKISATDAAIAHQETPDRITAGQTAATFCQGALDARPCLQPGIVNAPALLRRPLAGEPVVRIGPGEYLANREARTTQRSPAVAVQHDGKRAWATAPISAEHGAIDFAPRIPGRFGHNST